MAPAFTGGCLCGRVRYRADAAATNPHFCSCRQCQRWSGAPAVAWIDVPLASVRFDGPGGEPEWFRSSPRARRAFCPACGSTLAAQDDGAALIALTMGTLDDPELAVPRRQSFPRSAPSWLRLCPKPRKAGTAGA
jgi:hypothetical protein